MNVPHRYFSRSAVPLRTAQEVLDPNELADLVASTVEGGGGRYGRRIELATANGDDSLSSDCR